MSVLCIRGICISCCGLSDQGSPVTYFITAEHASRSCSYHPALICCYTSDRYHDVKSASDQRWPPAAGSAASARAAEENMRSGGSPPARSGPRYGGRSSRTGRTLKPVVGVSDLGGVPGFGCKYALLQNLVVPHAHAHHAGAHPCSHSSLLPSSCVWQEFSDARGSMLRVHRSLLYVENKACFWAQPEQITSG